MKKASKISSFSKVLGANLWLAFLCLFDSGALHFVCGGKIHITYRKPFKGEKVAVLYSYLCGLDGCCRNPISKLKITFYIFPLF